jgi:LPXTG-site transpeptidase (sortase) family protein
MVGIFLSYVISNIKSFYIYSKYSVVNKLNPINIEKQINLTAQANQKKELTNNIYIPKIFINSKIVWDISNEFFFDNLKNGISHLANSGYPNEKGKNMILGGLSSYPFWYNLPNSNNFALLNKLENGDRININYKNNNYVYQVVSIQNTDKGELIINSAPLNKKLLTLFTYYPYGLNTYKLVISCEQISSSDKSTTIEP